jgi:hypothetical protein
MKKNKNPILLSMIVMAAVILVMAQFSAVAYSQGVQIISASPGQTITYQGHGGAGSQVTLEVSATISTGVDNNHYVSRMNGVNIPGGSRFSITARPVDSLTVSGSPNWAGGLSYSLQGSVNNHVGSASMNDVPGGTYNILVSGIANGSGSVSITVYAYQSQGVGGDGNFTASISTAGLPPAVYSVKQDGTEVAKVYLGVEAPATPTPTAAPTTAPTSNPASTPGVTTTAGPSTITPVPNSSNTATPGATETVAPPVISVTSTPPSPGNNPLLMTLALMIGAVVAGLVLGYIIVFVILKK